LPPTRAAHWAEYETDNSYTAEQRERKRAAIQEFVRRTQPSLLLDVGCNGGEYSQLALESGAKSAIGFERDGPAVNRAVLRADALNDTFLPLQMDIQNLSPAQGWGLDERRSIVERLRPDAVLCLALIHHLVLTESVPLGRVVEEIVALAPAGIIEFVPPDDPMARKITGVPERRLHRYDLPTFLSTLSQTATVTNQILLSENGRVLVEYRRER
jgi:ribosomal protein L11 methylase PrmA